MPWKMEPRFPVLNLLPCAEIPEWLIDISHDVFDIFPIFLLPSQVISPLSFTLWVLMKNVIILSALFPQYFSHVRGADTFISFQRLWLKAFLSLFRNYLWILTVLFVSLAIGRRILWDQFTLPFLLRSQPQVLLNESVGNRFSFQVQKDWVRISTQCFPVFLCDVSLLSPWSSTYWDIP